MITGIIYLVLALALGLSFTRWVQLAFTGIEALAVSLTVGLFGFSWLMVIPCLILPYTFGLPLGCAATIVTTLVLISRGSTWSHRRLSRQATVVWVIFAIATAAFWGQLMFSHDLPLMAGNIVSGGSTWGDFGFHASIISHQALAAKLPLDLPVASGVPLAYYFLIDFLSAIWLRAGWSFNLALAVPGALLAWSLTQLLVSFGWRLYGRLGGGFLGAILALTNGSAVGLSVATSDWRSSGLSLASWLHHVPKNYSGIDAVNAHFNNAVADLIMPQRPFLFGLGLWLIVGILWQAGLAHHRARWIITGAVLCGLMPMAHVYSFFTAGLLYASLTLWVMVKQPDQRRTWLIGAAVIAVIAMPQLAWQQLSAGGSAGFFTAGWDRLPGESLIGFEWRNFGLALVVLVALALWLCMRRAAYWRPWLIPFLALFVGAQIYSLQPFAFDNLKLLFYVYVMAMLAVGGLIWRARRGWRIILSLVAVVCLSVPGTLTIIREFQQQDVFASVDDQGLAAWVKTNTPTTAIFATTDQPNQPVATLAGRTLVFGYSGWLYSRHINYTTRQDAVQSLLSGQTDANVVRYHPGYLAVNTNEPSEWSVDRTALLGFHLVYSNPTWTVYQLSGN